MRICVIFNPVAQGEKAGQFRRSLGAIAGACELKQTDGAGAARRLAAEAARAGFDVVVAAGGDGTLNEVLNGLADVPDGLQRVRLGVLPLGTINVFAREMGIPTAFDPAWQTILQGRDVCIDLPWVDYHENGIPARRCFAQLAGAGLDARAIELVSWSLKKKIGSLAYVTAGLKALGRPQLAITVADGQHRETGELVLVGNGRFYGGAFTLFPGANQQDQMLDLCVLPRANWPTLLRCGFSLLLQGRLPAGAARRASSRVKSTLASFDWE